MVAYSQLFFSKQHRSDSIEATACWHDGRDKLLAVSQLHTLNLQVNMCEVRNHFKGADDSYDTLFSGPLHDVNVAVL
jgi:hypothetical protein